MDGAHLANTNIEPLVINQPVGFMTENDEHALQLKDELADWLYTKEPVPLEFEDEPGRTYFAVVHNTVEDFEKIIDFRQGTIQFLCVDPYGYGPEITETFPFGFPVRTITNEGTANAKPIIEMTAKESTTYALVQNQDDTLEIDGESYPKYLMIGRPHEVDQEPFEKYQRRFHANGSNLVGWSNASNSDIDGGTVDGNITTRGGQFVADSYGTGSNWHGPALKATLDAPVQDFRLSAYLNFYNLAEAAMIGRIEIYLLDVNGNAVGKMALIDRSASRANVFAELRAGDRDANDMIINENGNKPGTWNNFSGVMRLEREWDNLRNENIWSAYIGMRASDGTEYGRRIVSAHRDGGQHNAQVAQIVMHFGVVGDHEPIGSNSGISSLILDEIVQEPEGVPWVMHEGDKVKFDCNTGKVFLNDEQRNDLLDRGFDFFDLVKGENRLVVDPSIFDTKVRYKPTYR